MAYLEPDFDPDVFVSYSHGDPRKKGDAFLRQWTLDTVTALKKYFEIDPEFDDLVIWCDENIDPTEQLDAQLRGNVTRSGILIIVMSKRYLDSNWCMDEREWFQDQIRSHPFDKGRAFIVKAQPTEETKWPNFLCDGRAHGMTGFKFFNQDTEIPLGFPRSHLKDDEFLLALTQLYTKLTRRLRELKQHAETRTKPVAKPVTLMSPPRRIYLHAGHKYALERDEVKLALTQCGFEPIWTPAAADSAIKANTIKATRKESRERIELAKTCQALAFVNCDGELSDANDFKAICRYERESMEDGRDRPLPCVVLECSGGAPLGYTPSEWQAERIDMTVAGWGDEFSAWLERALEPRDGSAP